jgi:putative molybdopterin biosynthesis protein
MKQDQFLEVIDRDEAERRFHAVLDLRPLAAEEIALSASFGRVLAVDVIAPLDVPGFDRADVDGFAVRAEDTFGAAEENPRLLRLNAEILSTGKVPSQTILSGTATCLATGAVVPRGANAIVMIEYTDVESCTLRVRRPVTPGSNITFAGTDIGRGELVLRRGDVLTSRETGVLAALGLAQVSVVRRPRVAILSSGDELLPPGAAMRPGLIFDSNATVVADAVNELGGEAVRLGIVPDDAARLEQALREALQYDVVLLSGGTSKGAGDLSYRVLNRLGSPGIVAHGVALKPGKPLCLAAIRLELAQPPRTVPLAILPGFPTSAIFTFHEFLAPVIRALAGRPKDQAEIVRAHLPLRVNSERGRTEYLLVNLVADTPLRSQEAAAAPSCIAYPMGKGSGSVTTFSRADGFVVIPRQREYLEAGEVVDVQLLSRGLQPADLVVIGSHCVGLDYLLTELRQRGFCSKFLAVGSTGGLAAARRGECDVAGIHLLDPVTNIYNQPFLDNSLSLVRGYGRRQGIIYRRGDPRFEGQSVPEAVAAALADPDCVLISRNRGSGTRVLIDGLLGNASPLGHLTEARSHNAVAAAVVQSRADWGVAIRNVVDETVLGFLPLQEELYDFVIPTNRRNRPAVQAFVLLLKEEAIRQKLAELGFLLPANA